ncbi:MULTISPECIES: Lrp/AsnC family transcriptional regulator [Chryseobacterium]|uniref:Lrp/AsnC family leucine-responsive transcriptional regulator/Lrp/AsnC family transcriptional regulator n=3 Tax=Chryseobacterium TaxID=59732 RepID=A0A543EHQ4_9FLAO|nr:MULTISPECIES: Lrp/AsnC family transcriptional regulator [Chryseobacterium]MBP1164411.1 DNA-binding Lrp family transcriptional regulator [Chryseobacterium sp. PvR013]KYH07701.1 AsnC family transcriptional regulator [Chryseobacterium cucumeris]MDH5033736.1 Lrp/AsnC family transcriptional regulator [Chryseobacterium cucumeris]MDR3025099.1 Lrp/AsnC family transcriptional regulator [Chryseobacterium sp.]MDR4890569.1 Lrp/AsnC family transcriptional regulator [Chryseobacterium sp. CFS7]
MEQLDDKDLQLLRLLQKNAKLTVKELAKEVNLSTSPVFERVKRLEQEGFVKRYAAVLDAEKLNRGFTVFCQIKLKIHDRSVGYDFVKEILEIEEVAECYNISGDFDFLLKVQVRDMKHYQDFVFNKLGSVDSIGSTHSTFVMAEVKNNHGLTI